MKIKTSYKQDLRQKQKLWLSLTSRTRKLRIKLYFWRKLGLICETDNKVGFIYIEMIQFLHEAFLHYL